MHGLLADAVSSLLFVQSTNYGMQSVESCIGMLQILVGSYNAWTYILTYVSLH